MLKRIALLTAVLVALSACQSTTEPTAATATRTLTATDTTSGDWTPTLGGTATYVTQTGRWNRIGNHVWITGILYVNTLGTGTSTQIDGLPFTSMDGQEPSGSVGYYQGLNINVTSLMITVRPNSTLIAFHAGLGLDNKSPTVSPLQSGSLVYFSAEYEAKH